MQEEAVLNLRWDYFSSHLATTLDNCYEKQHFVDISLVCKNGTVLKCHKMVLASASSFFQRLLVKNDHPHPMIILYDIEADDLKTIINFMYCGEIQVVKSEVKRLLKIAEKLEISGLKDIRSSEQFNENYTNLRNPEIKTSNKVPVKPIVNLPKASYNLRQRNVVPKNPNSGNSNRKIDDISPKKAVILNNDVVSLPSTSKNCNNFSDETNRSLKRSLEDCQYWKKLRLLNEVEIIRRDDDNDSGINCGIFIKNEIDISEDEDGKGEKLVELGPGVEIFRTYTRRKELANDNKSSS